MTPATKEPKELTTAQAVALDREICTDFKSWKDEGGKLWKKIQEMVDGNGHQKLPEPLPLEEWLSSRFTYSSSYIFARIQQRRALQEVGASETLIQKIPEGNARQLVRLPPKQRKALLQKATTLTVKQCKEVVNEIRESTLGKPEPWDTWAVRVPKSVHGKLIEARDKVARVLQVDLEDKETFMKNMITVMEAWATLILTTDESQLKVEIEGD